MGYSNKYFSREMASESGKSKLLTNSGGPELGEVSHIIAEQVDLRRHVCGNGMSLSLKMLGLPNGCANSRLVTNKYFVEIMAPQSSISIKKS